MIRTSKSRDTGHARCEREQLRKPAEKDGARAKTGGSSATAQSSLFSSSRHDYAVQAQIEKSVSTDSKNPRNMSEEEKLNRNRKRAEVYALNQLHKSIETENYERVRSQRHFIAESRDMTSVYSDDSSVCPSSYHTMVASRPSRRSAPIEKTRGGQSSKACVRTAVKQEQRLFGGV